MWENLFRPYAAVITVIVFALIGLLWLVGANLPLLAPFSQGLRDFELTDIAYAQLRRAAPEIDPRILIVNTGLPERGQLAAMLERIIAAQPKAIGLDVLLEGRKAPLADSLLQQALKESDRIVLASTLEHYREDQGYFQKENGVDTFFSNHARTGYVNFPSLSSQTIRFFSPQEMTATGPAYSFALELARRYDPQAAERLFKRKKQLERIHYATSADRFILFQPEQILDSALDLRPLLQGKIVLLGFNGNPGDDCNLLDKFYTPLNERYAGRSEPDMHGIAIHANIIQMILDGRFVREVPFWLSLLLAIWLCFAGVALWEQVYRRFPELHHPIIRLLQLLGFMVLFFVIVLLFHGLRLKWDFTLGLLAWLLFVDVALSYEGCLRLRRPWNSWLPRTMRRE